MLKKIKKLLGIKRTYERLRECPTCNGWGFLDSFEYKRYLKSLK